VYRRAAEVDPGNFGAQRNLATALLDAGNAPEAVVHAQAAIALKPGDAVARDLLNRALLLGDRNASRR
jgi:tetratricopeptide (TPR) repeat protein